MKPVDVLEKIKNEFDFDCDVDYSYYEDSYYDTVEEIAVLGAMCDVQADEIYMGLVKSLGLKADIDVELMSFMHEIGHHMTIDSLSDYDIAVSMWIEEGAAEQKDYMAYFLCPEEREATMWAVDFVNEHKEFFEMINKELMEVLYD